jgi:hypothetical protein
MRPLFLILQYLEVSLLAYIRVCRHENTLSVLAEGRDHKVHIYLEYHSVCPLVGIGTPTPSPASWLMMHGHFHDARTFLVCANIFRMRKHFHDAQTFLV